MKKSILFLIVTYLVSFELKAQNVPNGGFENWTSFGLYEMPDSWQTTDSISLTQGTHSVTKETVNIHSGTYAMKLTPFTYILTIPGTASNGHINYSTLAIEGGTPDTVRHAKLDGWYQFAPVSNDSCTILVTLYKWNSSTSMRDVVGGGAFCTQTAAATYTPFEITLDYASSSTPDSVLIVVYSSALGGSHMGTVLYVDDLSFSGIAGVNELPASVQSIHVYPVPAGNELNVDLALSKKVRSSFVITDVSGRKMISHAMNQSKEKIDISALASGNYFYNLVDDGGNNLSTGKFTVSR